MKLLGITVDNSYKFDTHINNICTKANQKLSVLSKMRNILNFKQRIIIILKSFSESQFKYCPLIWMFYSRKANNKINKIHERTLRIHCWKSVEIRSYFWSVFSCIGTEYGDLFSPNTGKYGPEITAYLDTFHAAIVYQDDTSSFEELLEKDNFFSIHYQNIQTLAIEMYKVYYGLSENSFYIFKNSRSSYNLRSQGNLEIPC